MQGRLSMPINDKIQSFPMNSWKQEFEIASKCGFDIIEWVFDDYLENPLLYSENLSEIISLSEKYHIQINSVCADYFMEKKLFNESQDMLFDNLKILKKLVYQSEKLNISIIEIPLVDNSSLKTNDDKLQLIQNIEKIIPTLDDTGVTLVLETDLPPMEFRDLLIQFNHPKILANYDSGNSASLGYNSKEELDILKKWIKNVHVKDRKFQGVTVPFGTGDADFDLFFSSLSKINYSDDLIIQGARFENEAITSEVTCQIYQEFIKQNVDKYYI
jgi:L-ribulose-5-phosphate 3-epimerase